MPILALVRDKALPAYLYGTGSVIWNAPIYLKSVRVLLYAYALNQLRVSACWKSVARINGVRQTMRDVQRRSKVRVLSCEESQ